MRTMQKLYLPFCLMEINNKNMETKMWDFVQVVLVCNYKYGKFENHEFKFDKSNAHSFRA
jgi:hypothetical protein